MKQVAQAVSKNASFRHHVAAELTQEILNSPEPKDFLIASESQLCRRFGVSRVTIRLALYDLEHKGLIYRRHGKGTFAHGSSTRVHRSLGILIPSSEALKDPGFVEMMRGVLAAITPLHASLVLITTSPVEWQSELAGNLAGVIVVRQDITSEELEIFKKRNLPFLHIREAHLAVEDCDFFDVGRRTAQALNYASLTGEPVGEIKVSGINTDLTREL
jgi:Bacterial regulatory proteins, gntR family